MGEGETTSARSPTYGPTSPSPDCGDAPSSSMVFVGTGVSTGIPVIGHVDKDCACVDAIMNPSGPNRRNNVSLLIRHAGSNVLIDAGKTYRDAYFRTLAPRKVSQIHAVLFTHDHADAVFGIDDLRDMQRFRHEGLTFVCETPLPVYLTEQTLGTLCRGFDYIINNSTTVGPADDHVDEPVREVVVQRRVACLRLRMVDDTRVRPVRFEPGILTGMPFYSVPVFHGGDYRCLGFAFGSGCHIDCDTPAEERAPVDRTRHEKRTGDGPCVVYLSDVSAVPSDVMSCLDDMSPIDVLVVDMLFDEPQKHFSHFTVNEAWDLIVRLQPKKAYGTGMYCSVEHHSMSAALKARLAEHKANLAPGEHCRIDTVELAFDGLELPL